MHKILIIEDDWDIKEVLMLYLKKANYDVYVADTLAKGEELLREVAPDLILLDVNLPDGNGFQFAKKIRELTDAVLIFVTIHNFIQQKLEGFEVGADDYVTKPFVAKEVVARVQAHLRRREGTAIDKKLTINDLCIDMETKEVTKNGKRINLYVKEKKLLFYLAKHPNQVLSSEQIIDEVWGLDGIADPKVLAVHISTLRRKLGESYAGGSIIQTVRGFGYRFFPYSQQSG